jgi:hypothetical protein
MFQAAAAGAAGVNFHAGVHNRRPADDKAYTPIARGEGGRHHARPLYYAMLMFAQAARGALVPVRLATDMRALAAFAVRTPEGSLRVFLVNKDFARAVRVGMDARRSFAAVSVMRLAGPSADATSGITLGGASVDDFGRWAPVTVVVAHAAGGEIAIDVPAASAALVSLHD